MVGIPISTLTTVSLPHLLSKLDHDNKRKWKNRYKSLKTGSISAGFGTIVAVEGKALVCDVVNSKLKAYGYKSLFAILLGPGTQTLMVPLYVFSYATKFRKLITSVANLGAFVTKGQFGIANFGWIFADYALFGEPVPITENNTFAILPNETDTPFIDVISEVIDES